MVARDFTKFELVIAAYIPHREVSCLPACRSRGLTATCYLLVPKETPLHCLLQLVYLHVFLAELVLELGLLVLQFNDLFVEVIAVTLHPVSLVFHLLELIFEPVFALLDGLVELLSALPLAGQLLLRVSQRRLRLGHLLTHLLPEVNVAHSLLHHEVH